MTNEKEDILSSYELINEYEGLAMEPQNLSNLWNFRLVPQKQSISLIKKKE
jgi:hypothetical protein